MQRRSYLAAMAASALSLPFARRSGAEEGKSAGIPANSTRYHQNIRPAPQSEAALKLVGMRRGREMELRTLSIYRQEMTGDKTVGGELNYFIAPICALLTNPKPQEGDPSYFFEVNRNPENGVIHAETTLRIFSEEVRTKTLERLLSRDGGDVSFIVEQAVTRYNGDAGVEGADAKTAQAKSKAEARNRLWPTLNNPKVSLDEKLRQLNETGLNIDILPWPLIHMVAVCKDSRTNEVYAVTETQSLSETAEEVLLSWKFNEEEYRRLAEAEKRETVQFIYYYTYVGRKSQYGSIETHGELNVKAAVDEVIGSTQSSGQAPLFGNEKRKVLQRVQATVRTNIIADNPTVIPLLREGNLSSMLFQPDTLMTMDEIAGDPATRAAFLQYIKPHLQKLREQLKESKVDVTIHENENGASKTSSSGGSFFGLFGGSSENTSFRRALDRFEHESGVSTGWDKETESFVPHKVSVCRLQSGWQNKIFEDSKTVHLAVGEADNYLESKPIFSVFRDENASRLLEASLQRSQLWREREVVEQSLKEALEELADRVNSAGGLFDRETFVPEAIHPVPKRERRIGEELIEPLALIALIDPNREAARMSEKAHRLESELHLAGMELSNARAETRNAKKEARNPGSPLGKLVQQQAVLVSEVRRLTNELCRIDTELDRLRKD